MRIKKVDMTCLLYSKKEEFFLDSSTQSTLAFTQL